MKRDFQINDVINRFTQLFPRGETALLTAYLQAATLMNNSQVLFNHLFHSADKEVFQDHLAELRFALMFSGLKYKVEFEPFGKEGPDIRIFNDRFDFIIEVTRIRLIHSLTVLDLSDDDAILPKYGNIERDTRKTIGKITRKFRQTNHNNSIIAIWNDDDELEEIEMEFAYNYIKSQYTNNNVLFILYASKWYPFNQQIYCFPFNINESVTNELCQTLENSSMDDLIKEAIL